MTTSLFMLILGGFFIGGTFSVWKNGNKQLAVFPALLAVVSLIAAYLWSRS